MTTGPEPHAQRTPPAPPAPSAADSPAGARVPTGPPAPKKRRRWGWPVAVVGALVIGGAIGSAGSGGDPTTSDEYQDVAAERDELRDAIDVANGRADDAEARANTAEAEAREQIAGLDSREQELDARQVDVEAREAAVTATEVRIASTQIGVGTWTVGVDVEPGTYRTAEAVTGTCYWGIYRSGTNKADIIDNDIVEGGYPTVTLSAGQDFENGCGAWNKQ